MRKDALEQEQDLGCMTEGFKQVAALMLVGRAGGNINWPDYKG
jgi:hypothetical protein